MPSTSEQTVTDLRKMHAAIDAAAAVLGRMPPGIYYGFDAEGTLDLQAPTQAAVREIRRHFTIPSPTWKKYYNKMSKWWEYIGQWRGLRVKIYAVKEAPPTCRKIVIKETVIERVPVAFEEREVEKETFVWECGPEEGDDADTAVAKAEKEE